MIDLKAPATIDDLRFKHLAAYRSESFMEQGHAPTVATKVKFIASFFGIVEPLVYTFDYNDISKVYRHCLELFNGWQLSKPEKEIKVNGIEYELIDLKRPSAGFVADCSLSDFNADPVRLACICYIPKGTNYGDVDSHLNLKHPIEQRYEEFKEHFPLKVFLDLEGFFLLGCAKSLRIYTARTRAITRARRRALAVILGWKLLTSSLKSMITSGTKSRK